MIRPQPVVQAQIGSMSFSGSVYLRFEVTQETFRRVEVQLRFSQGQGCGGPTGPFAISGNIFSDVLAGATAPPTLDTFSFGQTGPNAIETRRMTAPITLTMTPTERFAADVSLSTTFGPPPREEDDLCGYEAELPATFTGQARVGCEERDAIPPPEFDGGWPDGSPGCRAVMESFGFPQ